MTDDVDSKQARAYAAARCVKLLTVVNSSCKLDVDPNQRYCQDGKDEAKEDHDDPSCCLHIRTNVFSVHPYSEGRQPLIEELTQTFPESLLLPP